MQSLYFYLLNCYIIMGHCRKNKATLILLTCNQTGSWAGKPAAFDLSVTSPKHCSNDAKCDDELAWVCVPIYLMKLGERRLLESYLPASFTFSHLLLKSQSQWFLLNYMASEPSPDLVRANAIAASFVIVIFILN